MVFEPQNARFEGEEAGWQRGCPLAYSAPREEADAGSNGNKRKGGGKQDDRAALGCIPSGVMRRGRLKI